MKININKQVCDRCSKKEIKKDTDGVTLSFRGTDVIIENGRKTPCFSYGDIRPGFASYI